MSLICSNCGRVCPTCGGDDAVEIDRLRSLLVGSLLVGFVLDAMERSFDGCEGGYQSDRRGELITKIEAMREAGDADGAWALCDEWLSGGRP